MHGDIHNYGFAKPASFNRELCSKFSFDCIFENVDKTTTFLVYSEGYSELYFD